jgi:F-type H+-transporting ATPase subunit alpha
VEVLKQDRNAPVSVELQVAIIYAVVNNFLKEIPVSDISRFEKELFEYLTATKDELLADIRNTGVMTAENEAVLKEAIIACRDKFLGKA